MLIFIIVLIIEPDPGEVIKLRLQTAVRGHSEWKERSLKFWNGELLGDQQERASES